MRALFAYPFLTVAAFLAGCGGGVSDPMPRSLDIPEDLDPFLKDAFTVCPIAMSSIDDAVKKVKELGWKKDVRDSEPVHPPWLDLYQFEKNEKDISIYVWHSPNSVSVTCQAQVSEEEDYPDFEPISQFGFDGEYEWHKGYGFGNWMIGNYPHDVSISAQANKYYSIVVFNRRVPKSHPLYNR